MKHICTTLVVILLCYNAFAQFQGQVYKYNPVIKVTANSKEKKLAWCGGFNCPEFGLADLDHDGKKDLVIFERHTGVRTFINHGNIVPDYVFAPAFEVNFPEVGGSMKLIDYNCDGITDLVTSGGGFALWTGYYNSKNELTFRFYEALKYNNDTFATGYNNAWVSPEDIPEVVDVDHDGDLDFLSFDIDGNKVAWFKNVQVEKGLPCDSVKIGLKDKCWGKFYQNGWLTHRLHYNCDYDNSGLIPPGAKKTHSGNTMCLIDMDGDGDYDYLNGGVGYNNIVYLQNGRIPYSTNNRDSMIIQDTTWSKSGYVVNIASWPAPFFIDIDQDGKRDLLLAPNTTGENYSCITFMKNTGTDAIPNFTFQTDTFLVDETIDVGTAAYPMFFDYNKDGWPDLFVGSDGYKQADGTYKSRISYYKNTSRYDTASMDLQTTDFLGLSTENFKGAALAVGDIDNDGKTDLVIGHTDGTLSYYKNTAASNSIQPDWKPGKAILTDIAGKQINVGGNAAPFIYDMDKDGKPDLIIGSYSGYIQYYRNTGVVPGQVSLQLINKKLGGVKVDGPNPGQSYSVPFIGKMDSSGADYLLVGSSSGLLYRFTGFQNGDTVGPYLMIDSMYSYIDTSHLSVTHRGNYAGFRSAPAIADVDGNGKMEMLVGDVYGGLILYEQDSFVIDTNKHLAVNTPVNIKKQVTVYPNPSGNIVTVSWTENFAQSNVSVSLTNVAGQRVLEQTIDPGVLHTRLNVEGLLPGIYYCTVRSASSSEVVQIAVVR